MWNKIIDPIQDGKEILRSQSRYNKQPLNITADGGISSHPTVQNKTPR